MTDHVMSKFRIKRLKKLQKRQPLLFARIAAAEMDLGRFRQARKKLENGLERYPDYTTARILLAECCSILNDNKKALEQWKTAREQDPYNRRILAGLVSELAIASEGNALNEALFALYHIDPLDEKNTRRLKENLLERAKKSHPEITSWPMNWHPADFTPDGAFANQVAKQLGLMEQRAELPEDVRPEIDQAAVEEIVSRMVMKSESEDGTAPELEEKQTKTLVIEPDVAAGELETAEEEPEVVAETDMGIETEKADEEAPAEDLFEIPLPTEETTNEDETIAEGVSQDEEHTPETVGSDAGPVSSVVEGETADQILEEREDEPETVSEQADTVIKTEEAVETELPDAHVDEEETSDSAPDGGEVIEEPREEVKTHAEKSHDDVDDFAEMLELTDTYLAENSDFASADEALERLQRDEEETKESEVAAKDIASHEEDSGSVENEETVPDFHEAFELAGIKPEEVVDVAALMNKISGSGPPLVDPPDIQTLEQQHTETGIDSAEQLPDADDTMVAQREVGSEDIIIGEFPDDVAIERLAGAEDVEVIPAESAPLDEAVRLEPPTKSRYLEKEEVRKLIRLLDKREQPAETKDEPEALDSPPADDAGEPLSESIRAEEDPGFDDTASEPTSGVDSMEETEAAADIKEVADQMLEMDTVPEAGPAEPEAPSEEKQPGSGLGLKNNEMNQLEEELEQLGTSSVQEFAEIGAKFAEDVIIPGSEENREAVSDEPVGELKLELSTGEAPPSSAETVPPETEQEQDNGQSVGIRGPVTKTFAQVLLNQEQYQLALETCEKLLENNPSDKDIKRMIIQAKTGLERHGD